MPNDKFTGPRLLPRGSLFGTGGAAPCATPVRRRVNRFRLSVKNKEFYTIF